VLQEHCRLVGEAVDGLRRAERGGPDRGLGWPARGEIAGARRRLARALRELEEAAFDPLVLSAAELADAEALGPEARPVP
jgi:hypothetical protein